MTNYLNSCTRTFLQTLNLIEKYNIEELVYQKFHTPIIFFFFLIFSVMFFVLYYILVYSRSSEIDINDKIEMNKMGGREVIPSQRRFVGPSPTLSRVRYKYRKG